MHLSWRVGLLRVDAFCAGAKAPFKLPPQEAVTPIHSILPPATGVKPFIFPLDRCLSLNNLLDL